MKKIYLFITLNILVVSIHAQFQWANKGGLWAYDYGYGVVTDNAGNVYCAGKYEEAAVFNTATVTNAGNHDAFLVQYSSSGTLNWIRTAGGADGDYAEAIATDGTNYVYISGESEGSGVISFPGSTVTLQNVADNDAFFAKYDLGGNIQWAKRFGGVNSEKALGVACDNLGNVYICGYYTTTTTINGNNITGWGGRDIYLAKYDATGTFQWFKNAGSAGRDEAKFIKCDNNGNVYICGMCSNNSTFGAQTITTPDAYYDSFLAKYSTSDGTLQWVKVGGAVLDDVAWSLTIDNGGSVYVTGEFNSYIDFGNPPMGVPTTGNGNVYVARFDASGAVVWIQGAGGPMQDRARGIGTDGTSVYITGQFGGTAQFGSFTVSAPDSSDIFVAGLTSGGSFMWATSVGGPADALETLGYESGNGICAVNGAVYVTGATLDGGVFGSTTLSPWTRTDMFIAKLATAEVGIKENTQIGNINVYPNPNNGHFTIDLKQLPVQSIEVCIYNFMGQLVDKKISGSTDVSMDLNVQNSGVYTVEVKTADQKSFTKKLIVQN